MKFLGIDYGTKRVGLAVSDESESMAFPLSVIPNDEHLIDVLEALILERSIGTVVLGESKDYRGKDNPIMPAIRDLADRLAEKCNVEVRYEPEFLTSEEAKRIQGGGTELDASAAAIILQSFLEKRSHQRG